MIGSGSMIIGKCLLLTVMLQLDCITRHCWTKAEATFDLSIELPFMATAFVQTGNELHYFSDIEYHDSLVSGAPLKSDDQNAAMLNNQLQFTPSELQFDEQSVGIVKQREVRIYNPTASTVRFDAISGTTVHFHCSFLEHKEGLIENVLIVHSSLGSFTYSVKGKGKESAYRIRPLVGAKLPVNGTLISPVQVHNPHSTTLRVTEIYTSDGDLHLELPDVAPETQHPVSLWNIAPYETKTVMNAKLFGAEAEFQCCGTRRKYTYCSYRGRNYKKRGLYATVDLLDFGLIRSGDKSSELMLEIVSTLEKGIEIENLYLEGSEKFNGIYMEFASKPPISVKCGARQQPGAPKAIAKIVFDTKLLRVNEEGLKLVRYRGRIVAESRSGIHNITIPYTAQVYYGSIRPKVEETAFHSLLKPPVSRSISLTNDLPFGVAVWKITLDMEAQRRLLMAISNAKLISNVVTIAAGETKPVIYLQYVKKEKDEFATFFNIHTNVTTFRLPLVIFDGKLKIVLHSLHQDEFNFGLIDAGGSRSIQFSIINENPVAIAVKNLRRALPSITTLSLLNVGHSLALNLTNRKKSELSEAYREGEDFSLFGYSFAVFRYTLRAPNDRSILSDKFIIETDFQYSSFPVTYAVDQGTIIIIPEELIFSDAFPGRISSHSLKVFSTFKNDMRVLRISSLFGDRRIFLRRQIQKHSRMPLHTADGQWFTYGVKLPQNLAEIDYYLYSRLRRRFLALEAESRNYINGTIVIDTDKVKHLEVSLSSNLVWPKLLTRSTVHFPLTAVGNFTIVNLTLTNPSSLPVAVQLLPLVIYPDADTLIEFFRNELDSPLTDLIEMNETLMFSLRDTELFTLKPDSPVPKLREELESVLGITIPKFTLSMLLQPGMKVRVRVGFLPSDYVLRSSLLLIRNNLTVLEPVVLYGRGARMDMQVEGRTPRSRDPLTFEIQPHHLSDCHNPKRLFDTQTFTTLTVKRSFTIMNTGEVIFTVVNISINNVPCENRGFRILNCQPFQLKPNATHILDIAYTPDFLMSWNEAALQFYMHMNGTSWLFPMGASVPRHMLAKCHSALPRPPLKALLTGTILLICIKLLWDICWQADRTVTCGIKQQFSQVRRVMDLNTTDTRRIRDRGLSSLSKFKPSMSRRHVLHYSKDSNLLIRSFWQTASSVLWLFSFVWQFRGDEAQVAIKSARTRQTKTLVKCHVDSTYSTKGTHFGSGKSASTPSPNSSNTTSGSNSVGKRSGYKSSILSPFSAGHTSHSSISPKNVSVNEMCRSSKEKVNAEGTSIVKMKEAKENSRADSNRLRSGVLAESVAVSWISDSSNDYGRNTDLVKQDENPSSRDTEKLERNYVSPSVATLRITANGKNGYDWLSVHREKAVDERSETELSDSSALPEWADGPATANGKFFPVNVLLQFVKNRNGNVDEDFNALADAAERLFLSEKKLSAQLEASPPSPTTIVHPIWSEQGKDSQKSKKFLEMNFKSFELHKRTLITKCRISCLELIEQSLIGILGPVGSQLNHEKQSSNRPSALIEQLQRERKLAENHDYDKQANDESVWHMPPVSANNGWPPAPTNNFVQQQSASSGANSYLAEAVRTFRLNPEAPPFVIENRSNFRSRSTNLAPGSANIWASDSYSTSEVTPQDTESELDPNSAAVYWTEMFLADEEREKCP
ncbi:hypothetical protein DINM_002011 [Dirofilaria immitis]|nr:hypothetical protein [Dirofilaria immitis]